MPSILFVCTANICRSPMAGVIFRKIVADLGIETEWEIETAGTWGMGGIRASEGAQAVMKNWGIDLSGHRSKIVTSEILKSADLILTMEKGHKEALQIEYPYLADRVFLLSEMVGRSADIEDPIGKSLEFYKKTAEEINQVLESGLTLINRLVGTNQQFE